MCTHWFLQKINIFRHFQDFPFPISISISILHFHLHFYFYFPFSISDNSTKIFHFPSPFQFSISIFHFPFPTLPTTFFHSLSTIISEGWRQAGGNQERNHASRLTQSIHNGCPLAHSKTFETEGREGILPTFSSTTLLGSPPLAAPLFEPMIPKSLHFQKPALFSSSSQVPHQ